MVWTSLARPFLEGEVLNGVDDNGNGLIDEQGLSFTLFGDSVTIRLSIAQTNPEGEEITQTVETVVTVRNRTD